MGAERRDRTQGPQAVKYAAVYRSFLLEQPAIAAAPADIGTWVRVLAFASERESEVIPAFASDREWMSAAGVTMAEVESAIAAALLTRVEGGLLVGGFDHHGLATVQAKRANGALGGRPAKPVGSSQVNRPGNPSPSLSDPSPPSPPPEEKYPIAFELIWKATGKRGSKFDAHRAWVKAGKPHWGPVVEPAWTAYLKSERPVAGYVQDLSTWFNKRGHTQEWPEAKNAPPGPNGSATRPVAKAVERLPPPLRCQVHTENPRWTQRHPVDWCDACREQKARTAGREGEPVGLDELLKGDNMPWSASK